jgi:hypothetical protein
MSIPSPDFKIWLYGSKPLNPESIKLRNYLKNHGDWEGQTVDELKAYLDRRGLTAFLCDSFMSAVVEYHQYKEVGESR